MGARCCYGMKEGDSKAVVAHRVGGSQGGCGGSHGGCGRMGVVGWVW